MAVFTFSRTYGCGVREIGRELAQELNYMYFEKELVPLIFKQVRRTKKELKKMHPGRIPFQILCLILCAQHSPLSGEADWEKICLPIL